MCQLVVLTATLLVAAPAGAQAPVDPEAAIPTPSAWPETEIPMSERPCRSISDLLAHLSAQRGTRAVRGTAGFMFGTCRHRSFVGDASAPAAAEGSWRRVVAAVRTFLRAHPQARFLRGLAGERRAHLGALRDMHGGTITTRPVMWELAVDFRMDEGGTIHVSISRQADQAIRSVVRGMTCAPCVAPGPCACSEGTDARDETASWNDGAYVRVPPQGAPVIVRSWDPAS